MKELNAALAAALAELHEPHKEGKADAGQFSYSYMTLADLSRVVRAAFAQHGLAFTQHPTVVDGGVEVTTRVIHTSGETWSTGALWMPAAAKNAQALGSAVTYARRYQLAALVGLSGSDDDDAHAAINPGAGEPHAAQTRRPRGSSASSPTPPSATSPAPDTRTKQGPTRDNPMTDAQRRRLWATARAHGYGAKPELAAFACGLLEYEYDVERLGMLTKAEASKVIAALQAVEVAERESPTEPPDDPWATAEQPTL